MCRRRLTPVTRRFFFRRWLRVWHPTLRELVGTRSGMTLYDDASHSTGSCMPQPTLWTPDGAHSPFGHWMTRARTIIPRPREWSERAREALPTLLRNQMREPWHKRRLRGEKREGWLARSKVLHMFSLMKLCGMHPSRRSDFSSRWTQTRSSCHTYSSDSSNK